MIPEVAAERINSPISRRQRREEMDSEVVKIKLEGATLTPTINLMIREVAAEQNEYRMGRTTQMNSEEAKMRPKETNRIKQSTE